MIDWVVDRPGLRLGCGNSADYEGDADLVFSHLYGPLPKQLIGKPAIINLYGNKKAKAEEWCGAQLHEVGKWARGLTNTVYSANLSAPWQAPIFDLVEDEFEPGRGWFPEALPRSIFEMLAMHGELRPGATVFDGFMGRGTVGKVAGELGLSFVGIDINPERVALAREYLGCDSGGDVSGGAGLHVAGERSRRRGRRVQ